MGKAVGGASGVGCGVFSLVGLLMAVGLIAFLATGPMSSSGDGDGDGDGGGSREQQAADIADDVADMSVPGTIREGLVLAVAPSTGLVDGATLTVSGSGWDGSAQLELLTCIAGEPLMAGGATACDEGTRATVTTAPDGMLLGDYVAHRTITVVGSDFDCASAEGACIVVAGPPGAPESGASTPLSFTPA